MKLKGANIEKGETLECDSPECRQYAEDAKNGRIKLIRHILNVPEELRIAQHIKNTFPDDIYYIEDEEFIRQITSHGLVNEENEPDDGGYSDVDPGGYDDYKQEGIEI